MSQSPKNRIPGCEASLTNKDYLAKLMDWLLPDNAIFANIKFHGNTKWLPRQLVILALCWAWSSATNVTDAFLDALGWCGKLLGRSPLASYTGFMDAMTKWNVRFMELLGPVLHARMKEIGVKFWRSGKWILIAFDGSRATAPRTKSNEKAFCAPNYGHGQTAKYRDKKRSKNPRRRKKSTAAKRQAKRKKMKATIKVVQSERQKKSAAAKIPQEPVSAPQAPQTWITMLWHVGLRLPWMWKLGPSNSSEREHVMQMLEQGKFPKNTLFCGDAGFVGFPLWSAILSKGHQFLVRVGANVSLLRASVDYVIEEGGSVLCWPLESIRANHSPLRLCLVKMHIGKTKVWLLTSVLNADELSNEDLLLYYKKRWGIEVEFRGLKQTLDKGKLRCNNDQRLLVELNWSIMAMTIAELFALKEQLSKERPNRQKSEVPYHPIKRSLANTMRALRTCLQKLNAIPKLQADLQTQLGNAVTDTYIRTSSKKARHRPANPDKKPLGDPNVREMTLEEKANLQAMQETQAL